MIVSKLTQLKADGKILRSDSPPEGFAGFGEKFSPYKVYESYQEALYEIIQDRDYNDIVEIKIEIRTCGNVNENSPFKSIGKRR